MYWSPIRTRLLVGMLTPAIRAKAVTPFADFRVVRPTYLFLYEGNRVGRRPVPIIVCYRILPHLTAPRGGSGGGRTAPRLCSARISTSATRPSNQGLASLKNSLTGCGVFTVSIAIRQPLRPRFFA